MSTIIVSGGRSGLITPLLGVFGINESPAKISDWHESFFSGLADGEKKAREPDENHHTSARSLVSERDGMGVWGWADCRTTWLLDFWRAMLPQKRIFILVHENPRYLLAELIGRDEPVNIGDALAGWLAHEREMLRFFRAYPEDCMLIDGRQALSGPEDFILACTERLGIEPLSSLAGRCEPPKPPRHLDYLLASQAVALQPELDELCAEIESCLSWTHETGSTILSPGKPDLRDLQVAVHELWNIRQTMPGSAVATDPLRSMQHDLERMSRENSELKIALEKSNREAGQWQRLIERNPDYAFWLQVRNLAEEPSAG